MLKFNWIKLAEVGENGEGGGPPKEETPPATPPSNTPPPKEEGSNLDEFGYEKPPETKPPGEEGKDSSEKGKEADASKQKEATDKDSSSGYGKEPPKEDEIVDPPATLPPAKDETLGFELDVKDLTKTEIEKITKFAKDHKLSKEAAQAFVEMKKIEAATAKAADEAMEKQIKVTVAKQKADWHKELSQDPVFGGDKFDHNVKQVDKLMNDFMGNTKKVLTERKSMLPPYVMRDLSKLAEKLYESEKLIHGDGAASSGEKEKTAEKEFDHLSFYE